MDLAGAHWIPVLLAPLALAGLGWAALRAGRARLQAFLARERWAAAIPRFAPARRSRRLLLATGSLALASLALLGPTLGFSETEVARRGVDLVLALDTSRSMLARDIRPDRLERAKREIRGLARRIRGDRLALVAFAGDARVVCPLTHDAASFERFLDEADPSRNRVGGTNLAAAIRLGLEVFDGRTGAHEAIVLLTDGEDLAGEGLAAAKEAAARGIRLFVVGMGTVGGSKIAVESEGKESFLADAKGADVRSSLDLDGLRRIAEATGGDALTAVSSATPLDEIYDKRIAALADREFETSKRRVPVDRFQWPLAGALLVGLLEAAYAERRRR